MRLVRWSPWQDVFNVRRDMDHLMARFFGDTPMAMGNGRHVRSWTPAIDVFTREGDLVIRAELPGIDPEKDVEITLQDGVLTLRGERSRQESHEGDGVYRVESAYGSFERSVALPNGVREEQIRASYDRGVLEVVVTNAAELTSGKKIPIQVGEREALTVGSST